MNEIARREIVVKDTLGKKENAVIEIFAPYSIDEGVNYLCRVQVTGSIAESHDSGGVDSLQALSLSLKWLEVLINEKKKEGYEFYWLGGEHVMDSIDFFPKELLD